MTSTKPSDKRYTDSSGNECSLDTMCRREPEWAAHRMRWMIDRIAELDAEVTELRELTKDMRERSESKLTQAVDALQESIVGKTPRRTPELTERVAFLWYRKTASGRVAKSWQELSLETRQLCLLEVSEFLDLVLGKEQK